MPKHHGEAGGFGLGALSAGAVASALAGGYKFAEFAVKLKKLHEVGSENAVFIRLIQRVNVDLAETDRLLRLPEIKHALRNNPAKVKWIDYTVNSLCGAMEEMGQYTERVGNDLEKGKHVGARHRVRWVMDEYEKLMHRRMELSMCHQGLLQVIGFLAPLEPLKCCEPGYEVEVVEKPERWARGTNDLQERYESQIRRRHEADDIMRRREFSPTGGVTRVERRETTTRYPEHEEYRRREERSAREEYPGQEERSGPPPVYFDERAPRDYDDRAGSDPSEYGPMPRLRTHGPNSRL